ncbi:MAG TPA: Calx-beta domain-containing protein, partial [Thermoanaerobaculia bacterium]
MREKIVGLGVAALAASPVANAATFTVSNLNDNGAGSLRDALASANADAAADVITFQSGLTGTIALTTGQLYIGESVDIQGPGPSVITVSGEGSSRVFYLYDPDATLDVRIAGLTITDGLAAIGAGVVNFGENLTLDDVVITENFAQGSGAGLWSDSPNGGLTITDSTISGNEAASDGGGIYLYNATGPVLIENSVITGNSALSDGGGIYFYDPTGGVTIRDTEISNNHAAFGGGVFLYRSDGEFVIERSTISGNDALFGGGFFFYTPNDAILIENSTISGNDATSGSGGGIYFYALYNGMTINFTTITGNTAAGDGGGIYVQNGTAVVTNSIVAQNTSPQPTEYDFGSGETGSFDISFSAFGDSGPHMNLIAGNLPATDPQLGPLADNGGPTLTHRPALTSPVLNAADPSVVPPPSTDQRGEPRFYPTRADMGSVELVGGVIQFNPTTYSVAENGGSVTLTVVRDVGPDAATVDYTTNPGTATPGAGNDYTTTSGTLTFAPGDLSETINIPIVDDAAVEGSEQFTATLSNPSADATIGAGNPATVTITDFEEGQIVFASPTYSVNETGSTVTLTVNRINGSNGAASVMYSTSPGTASFNTDYQTAAGTLSWADGDATPRTIVIDIVDDSVVEGDEDFAVSLGSPTGATIGSPGGAIVTIIDDPAGTAEFSVAAVNTTEEAGSVTVTVTRTGGTEGPLTVNYATANGSAVTPSDYLPASGSVTFPAGSADPQTFTITLIDDNVNEGAEMFTANLTGANVGAQSTVTINLAASDANIPGVPTLSWFGRIFLTLMSALAGLYVMVRNRFSVFLVGMLLLGIVAAPPLSAATGRRSENGGKFSGTVQSATSLGGDLMLTMAGGLSITIPQ